MYLILTFSKPKYTNYFFLNRIIILGSLIFATLFFIGLVNLLKLIIDNRLLIPFPMFKSIAFFKRS